jgi:hypothetical protein
LAVRALLPWQGNGLEIGVGTGRFAAPLGVAFGIDPAIPTLSYARERGVSAASGIGEALPFSNAQFGYVLAVTTICFVSNIEATLAEARPLTTIQLEAFEGIVLNLRNQAGFAVGHISGSLSTVTDVIGQVPPCPYRGFTDISLLAS